MTNDGRNSLTYDAESRVRTSVYQSQTATYTYDAGALRVKKVAGSTTTRYIFAGAKVIAEYENGASPSSPTREYIFAGGQLVATHEGSALRYHHADHLSVRVTTDTSGAKIGEQGHFPFGENWYSSSTTTKFGFTSYERDGESLNDYAIFRTHVNRLGRFSSPDPVAGSLSNPQSLNRYTYVLNAPTSLVDPLGLSPFSLFENTAPLLHDGTLGFGGGGTLCYVNGARVPCSFAWSIVASGEGAALPAGMSPEGWAIGSNGPVWYSISYTHLGLSMTFPFQQSGADSLKESLRAAIKNVECADLLGGRAQAEAMIKNMSITNVYAGGWSPANSTQGEIADFIRLVDRDPELGTIYAGVDIGVRRQGGVLVWNRGPFTVLTGRAWEGLSVSQRATVIIHELYHVANPQPQTREKSGRDIARVCKTTAPPKDFEH